MVVPSPLNDSMGVVEFGRGRGGDAAAEKKERNLPQRWRRTTDRRGKVDDSSDDEGPRKRVKHNDEDDEEEGPIGVHGWRHATAENKKASSRNVWADIVQEEELTMKGNVMDMNDYRQTGDRSHVKIRRGAESYVVPTATLEENAASLEAGGHMEEQAPASTPSDDPFGDTADIGEVEAFGVGASFTGRNNRGNWQSRGGGGRGVRGGWMTKSREEHRNHQSTVRTEGEEKGGEAMEQGEAADGGNRRGGWRGSSRGFVPRGRDHWRGSDVRKRRWNGVQGGQGHAHAKDPKELMDGRYSLAGLMATEFQEDLTPKELGEAIAKALGEQVSDTVVKIVMAMGEKKGLELFEETKKAEQAGGVKTVDGSRRRTPGGVFILLFKSDVDVDTAVKSQESIFEESKAAYRKTLQSGDVGKDLDELQKLLETKKKELQAKEEKEGANPSQDGEELDYTEE